MKRNIIIFLIMLLSISIELIISNKYLKKEEIKIGKISYDKLNEIEIEEVLEEEIIFNSKELATSIINDTKLKYTNKNITLKLNIKTEDFSYIKYPDGTTSKSRNSTYVVTKNGEYKFLIYNSNNKYKEKVVKISKIDKTAPTGSCTAVVKEGKTSIVVNGKDELSGIKNYVYYGDGKKIKNQIGGTYNHNKELSKANVNIYDNAGNMLKTTCKITSSNTNEIISEGNEAGSCKATLKDGKTTYKVEGNNIKSYKYNGEYESNESTYTIDKYIRENNFVMVTDTNGKESKIKCITRLETMPVINPKGKGKIVHKAESETLKIQVQNESKFYVTYIWAKDPVNQLKKQYSKPVPIKNIFETIIKSNNLKNKIVFGFNNNYPTNGLNQDKLKKCPECKNKESLPLVIANGEVIANHCDNPSFDYRMAYIDGNNILHSNDKLAGKTAAERKAICDNIINSGAKNTFVAHKRTYLIDNYQIVDSLAYKTTKDWKQYFCQINNNYYVLLSSKKGENNKITIQAADNYLKQIGCKTAIPFDSGHSTNTFFKPSGTTKITTVTSADSSRKHTSILYFTELN